MTNESIPAYRPGADVTATAGAGGVVGKTFVDISGPLDVAAGTPITVVTATAAGLSVGVASRDTAAGGKLHILRNVGAIVPVTAGGTIARGAEVEVGSNGRAVTLASGKARGRAWSAGTSGSDVFIELY
ncbi:capsid cement protein [Microbacterium sp. NPDC080220]|uniref:capsid cement protein n=1 Tax=Microbacterium sp. NPDC080220 TaxID=3161017 RepID=UPI00342C083B